LLINLVVSLLYLYISVAFWRAVYGGTREAAGYTLPQMVTYMVGATVVGAAFTNSATRWVTRAVRDGTIVIDLLRPVSLPLMLLAEAVGEVVGEVLLYGLPMAVFGLLLFHMRLPADPWAYPPLALLVALGFVLRFLLSAIIGYTAFWTVQTRGLADIVYWIFFNLLGGAFVPYAFFPGVLQHILPWIPMAGLFNAPLNVLVGRTAPAAALRPALLDLGWIAVLVLGLWRVHTRAMRHVLSHGG
jgi:ABC-2 type transport system permease protein